MAKGTCSVDGCDRKVRSRNMCNGHYERWRLGKPVNGPLDARSWLPAECEIEDCDSKPVARGMCQLHWKHWKASGDPLLTVRDIADREERRLRAKRCTRCEKVKRLERFPRDAAGRNGRGTQCLACCRERAASRRATDPQLVRKQARESYARNKSGWTRRRLAAQYGITHEQAAAIFEAQGGRCAICRREIMFGGGQNLCHGHLDHDHVTGAPRGYLCPNCNKGLGMFADDPERLIVASEYLRAAQAT